MCHLSHVYPAGASLYFTVVCAQGEDPVAHWTPAKHAANDAILAAGGTISHHHGVGTDHRDWYAREIGPLGIAVLQAVKNAVDPSRDPQPRCAAAVPTQGACVMREFTAVVNPSAGGGSGAAAALLPLTRLLREGGAEVEVAYSNGLDHARVLARQAGQAGRVVLAVGGDGMAGGVGGALAGSDAVLGLVPAGRGNDFARALALPTEPVPLAELLLHAEPQRADADRGGLAPHHRRVAVLGSVYAGVDALANRYANRSRLLRGAASYYVGGARAVATWRPADFRITLDGRTSTSAAVTPSWPPTPATTGSVVRWPPTRASTTGCWTSSSSITRRRRCSSP